MWFLKSVFWKFILNNDVCSPLFNSIPILVIKSMENESSLILFKQTNWTKITKQYKSRRFQ